MTSPSPSPTGDNEWIVLHDDLAGIAFTFPRQVAPQSTSRPIAPGRSAQALNYTTEVDDVALSVLIVQIPHDVRALDPATTYRQMVAALIDAGAEDAAVSGVEKLSVHGRAATDGTITFTSAQGHKSHWRIRTVTTANASVSLQAQVFAAPGDATAASRVDAMFATLTASLEFT